MLRLLFSTRLQSLIGRYVAGSCLVLAVGACANASEPASSAGNPDVCRWLVRTQRSDWQANALSDYLKTQGLSLAQAPVAAGPQWWSLTLQATTHSSCQQQAGKLLSTPGLTDANPDQRASRPRPVRQP